MNNADLERLYRLGAPVAVRDPGYRLVDDGEPRPTRPDPSTPERL
jgi:hypothetical protein